jgi:hypothetical protein
MRGASVLKVFRALCGSSALVIAAIFAGVFAMGGIAVFSLVDESGTPTHDAETGVFQSTPLPPHDVVNAPSSNPQFSPQNSKQREFGFAENAQSSAYVERQTNSAQTAQSGNVRGAFEASESRSAPAASFRNSSPRFAIRPSAVGQSISQPSTGVSMGSQRVEVFVAKAPANNDAQGNQSSTSSVAKEDKTEKLSPVARVEPNSIATQTLPPSGRKPRVWPKPFTAEEERLRQQIGVQAFINYQHELATGAERTGESQ